VSTSLGFNFVYTLLDNSSLRCWSLHELHNAAVRPRLKSKKSVVYILPGSELAGPPTARHLAGSVSRNTVSVRK
jgi:hypothetical protein